MTETTLSLADIARLAEVQRPVVSMWRNRPLAGTPFPAPQPDGRFRTDEVVAYLTATGRGNNREPELATTITSAASPTADPSRRTALAIMLAVRAVLGGQSLADSDPEALLDAVESADPDDEWLFSEAEQVDIDQLCEIADAIADNSYSTAEAYERLRGAAAGPDGLADPVIGVLADLAAALLKGDAELVDAAGATDTVLRLCADESRADTPILVATGQARGTFRRYRVHGIDARPADLQEDWDLPDGSVILARVGDGESALTFIDDLSLQVGPGTATLIIGPAGVLIDELPADIVGLRDALLRRGLIRAAVRLPAGLGREGGGAQLGIWLMGTGDERHLWAGDLSSRGFSPAIRQQLVDDLVAVAREDRHRAFALLHRAETATLVALSQPLTALDISPADPLPVSAADDAARMAELAARLAEPMPDPLAGLRPVVTGGGAALSATLGDLARKRMVRLIPSRRIGSLPDGQMRLWTADAVRTRTPRGVDLLTLTSSCPDFTSTEPGDVVFTGSGAPRAVVDAEGGSAVAFPARILRVSKTASCSPRVIAATINGLGQSSGLAKWRSWRVPLVAGNRRDVEDLMCRIGAWEDQTRARLAQIEELRRLATRSVTSGAVAVLPVAPAPVESEQVEPTNSVESVSVRSASVESVSVDEKGQ